MDDLAPDVTAKGGASKPAPGLYLVATPIGNLRDITLRALDVLGAADLIACEDTRVSRKLLDRYRIDRPLIPYHDHNAAETRPRILARLAQGQVVAVISDAGTPMISDPGYKLVIDAIAAGHHVEAVPGASSLLAALCVAGLPTDRFLFAGFLPPKTEGRRKALAELGRLSATLVFLEGVSRLRDALADMASVLGADRPAAVARELTKLHETIARGSLSDLAARFAGAPPKGEVVIVVGPPLDQAATAEDLDTALRTALKHASVREAAMTVAAATGLPKRTVYARALALVDGAE